MKSYIALASALSAISGVDAFWRMPCRSQTGHGRIDPIVNPGQIADHLHTVHGGGNFGMSSTSADLTAPGSCTSCGVKQDHSAYWTPTLHFIYNNGTAVLVPQVGGMLSYYLYLLKDVQAFPEGFSMLAGNRNARHFDGSFPDTPLSFWPQSAEDQQFLQQRALGFNCLNYGRAPEPSLYRHIFPTQEQLDNDCKDGLRIELAFPSCGTGALDSADHKSHVAYPNLVKEGNCPKGYDVHYPFLFYETIWATQVFAGEDGQFSLSHGDPTGAGYHGDFMMGWESKDFLQQALDTCKNPSGNIADCPLFDLQSDADAAKCKFETPSILKKEEDVTSPRKGLPIEVPVQYGPQSATSYPCYGRDNAPPPTILPPSAAPSTFSEAKTVPYSAADPSKVSAALGGIVVNAIAPTADVAGSDQRGPVRPVLVGVASDDSGDDAPAAAAPPAPAAPTTTTSQTPPPAPVVTEAPPPPPPAAEKKAYYTSTYTSGNEVIEMVVETTEITVTATVTAEPHKRHLERHLHAHKR